MAMVELSGAEKCQEIQADRELDIRGEVCPRTFVLSRLALQELESGQVPSDPAERPGGCNQCSEEACARMGTAS